MKSKQIEATCKAIRALCRASEWLQAEGGDALIFMKDCDDAIAALTEILKNDNTWEE